MATNENIRVVQLTDDNDNPVSPVVNVGSLYDKNGNKVDNLLSYKVAGTTQTIPEVKDLVKDVNDKLATAGHAIGDVVQNVIGPLDDTWLPCDGRIVDSSIPLYSKISQNKYGDMSDDFRWVPIKGSQYETVTHSCLDSNYHKCEQHNLGDIVYRLNMMSSAPGYRVVAIDVSFDYGDTFKTFSNIAVSDTSKGYGIEVYRCRDSLLIIRREGYTGKRFTVYCGYTIINKNTSGALVWKNITSLSNTTTTNNNASFPEVQFVSHNSDVYCIIKTYNASVSRSEYPSVMYKINIDKNTCEQIVGISNIVYETNTSNYGKLLFALYDSDISKFIICVDTNSDTVLYKTSDMKTFTQITTFSIVSSFNALVASASGGYVSLHGYGTSSSSRFFTLVVDCVNNVKISVTEREFSSGNSIRPYSNIISVVNGKVLTYDKDTHDYLPNKLPKMLMYDFVNASPNVTVLDDRIYITSGSCGSLLFDMKNKRLPYIPGSYIKVK